MPDAHKNFAISAVATAPSPASSGTSLVVTSGQGSRFPNVPFNATVWPSGSNPDPTNAEIVRVTAISSDTLTIARAQEGTSARTILTGDQIASTITARTLRDAENGFNRITACIGTSLQQLGINTQSTGTASSQSPTSTLGMAIRYAAAATANSDAGWNSNGTATHLGLNPRIAARFQLTDYSLGSQRVWFALTTNTTVLRSADSPTVATIGFRWSTAAGDTNWQCVSTTGSSITIVDSGVTPSATAVRMSIACYQNAIDYYINGQYITTITTNIPSPVAIGYSLNTRTLEAVAKNIDITQVTIDEAMP